MEPQREEYFVNHIQTLLKEAGRRGYDRLSVGRCISQLIDPMPYLDGIDPFLHRIKHNEAIKLIQKRFQVVDQDILISGSIIGAPQSQVVTKTITPFTNRKEIADRIEGASLVRLFDQYLDGRTLTTLANVLGLIPDSIPDRIEILTSSKKFGSQAKRRCPKD